MEGRRGKGIERVLSSLETGKVVKGGRKGMAGREGAGSGGE